MLKRLCDAVTETGKLRQSISQIDFSKIYADPDKAARAKCDFFEKAGELADLQHVLLMLMKEV